FVWSSLGKGAERCCSLHRFDSSAVLVGRARALRDSDIGYGAIFVDHPSCPGRARLSPGRLPCRSSPALQSRHIISEVDTPGVPRPVRRPALEPELVDQLLSFFSDFLVGFELQNLAVENY